MTAPEPVSGRSEPRPAPQTDHTMVVHNLTDSAGRPAEGLRVTCTCTENGRRWQRTFERGLPVDDLTELKRQHCGDTQPSAVTLSLTCASVVGELACILPAGHPGPHHAEFRGHSIAWPDDEPVFGTETTPGGAS